MDWLLLNGQTQGIKVANLSFGMHVEQSNETDPLVLGTESVWDAGIMDVAAVGNFGRDGHMNVERGYYAER